MDNAAAKEFLLDYQAAFGSELPTKIRRDEFLRYISSKLESGGLSDEERAMYQSLVADARDFDVMQMMSEKLVSTLSVELRESLSQIPVGVLPKLLFNAETVQAGDIGPIVVVSSGLSAALLDIASWYVAATKIADLPAEVSEVEAAFYIVKTLIFNITGSRAWRPGKRPAPREPLRRNIIGGMWTNGLNFVLGHEYSHFILGHLHETSIQYRTANDSLPPLEVWQRSHQMEFEADLKGAEISFEFAKSLHDGDILAGSLGIEVVLNIIHLLDELFGASGEGTSHPKGSERLERFHIWLEEQYGAISVDRLRSATQFFAVAAKFGQELIPRMSPSTEYIVP